MHSQLTIRDYSLKVSLGCTPEERSVPQEVLFNVTFPFTEAVPGEKTDRLDDTLCYADVCEALRNTLENQSFQLVEHIAFKVSQVLREIFRDQDFYLKVHKVNPPIPNLNGGVFYEIFHSQQKC